MNPMKALQDAAQSNPRLAEDLKELNKDYAARLRQLAAQYEVELPPEDLSDEDLDSASGGIILFG